MRYYISIAMVLALAACEPSVSESSGVGFDSYDNYAKRRAAEAARDAELQRRAADESARVANKAEARRVAAQTPPPAAAPTSTSPQAPLSALNPTVNAAATGTSNPGISDEQNFDAVSGRESIESDRERLERQRSQYVQIEPTAVPTRSGSGGGANVVEFALSTTNRVGEPIYRRSKVFAESRYSRNCHKYAAPDLAQAAFLQAGGPSRDRKGLDPDGDGFACSWDPQPFRNAKRN